MTRPACAVLGALFLAHAAAARPVQQGGIVATMGGAAVAATTTGCGESWQVVSPPPTGNSLLAITWTGSQFVAVGALGTILSSPDGVTWTSQNRVTTSDLAGVAWTGGTLVAVGLVGTIITSPDGVTWTSHNWGVPFDLLDVAWTGTQVVAVGHGGEILTSPDATTWTSRSSPTSYPLSGVAWTGTQLVAVGQHGTIVTSADGVTWTLRSSGTPTNLSSVAWTDTRLVVVGDNGAVLTSADGITWTSQASGVSSQLGAVVWTGARLVAVGALGTVLTSQDGTVWSTQVSGTPNRLSGIAWTGTQLAAVGVSGTILTSQCGAPCSPPSITSQPQSQSIQSGQTATLSVAATGTAPLSYDWYQGTSGDASHPVGTNASSFTTPPLTTVTNYWVRVSNACGQVNSATATVSINIIAPSITVQPQSQSIQSGQTATLAVAATGTAPLSYQWYKGASGDTSSPVGTNVNGFTTPALTATTSYWVRVSNSGGHADSATATVTVSAIPPSITTQPQGQSIQSGQTATLSVAATGTAPLSYQWYRGASGDTSAAVGSNATTFTTPTLTATTSYWVRVSNSGGHADSATATVSVSSTSPAITSQPQSQSIQSGATATLSVVATGAPPLSFQWYQGASGDTSTQVATTDSFTTPPLTATTSYWVRVSNSDGHVDSETAAITVEPPYAYFVWVPVASHNPGKNDSRWRSDLGLLNPGTVTANAEIKFFGSGGAVSNTTFVAPGAQAMLTDVVGQLGGSNSGALEILSDQPLMVTARSYNQVSGDASCYPNGTQGQNYPAVVASDGLAAGQSAYLAGLVESASYRCNVGVVNTGTDPATVLVELYDGAGAKLGNYTVALIAGQWAQATQPFFNVAGQTAMDRGYAKVTVQAGSGVFAFASVIDNITNDPTTVAMQR
jgi:hypothetical protein